MAYIGQIPVSGDNSFRILDDISTFTQTFDGSSSATVSVSDSSISLTGHRFITGQRILYSTTGTAIGGLTSGTYYYIIKVDQNTIRLAASLVDANNNSNITLTALGTGTTHTINVAFDGINTKFKATYNNGTKAQVTRGAQLQISINGVLQQPSDSSTPSNGFGIDTDSTIVFSVPPVDTDVFWGNVIANNYPTFDTSDNTVDSFVGNGSQTNFTLSKTPPNNQNVLVTINGVVQYPTDATNVRAYSVTGNVLTFVEAPGSGVDIQVRHIGFAGATSSAVTGFYGRTGNVGLTTTDDIKVSSILVGTATSSGTANQRLQVAGGSYISGNLGIGITNPPYNLTVSPTGTPALSGLTSCVADFTALANSYTQVNLRNTSTGNAASADFVVTADNGSDTTNFVDLGINNSGFSTSTWTINGPNDAYLYTSDGSLSIGVAGIGKTLSFFTGGTLAENERLKITGSTIKIGSGATTGTADQDLQVTGGAYFSGSVGIGTTNPTAQLQINSSTSSSFYSYRNSGENSAWVVTGDSNVAALRFQNSLMHYRIGIQGSTQLVIRDVTNTGNRVAITSTGEVLINTTTITGTADQDLQVNSGAYVSGSVGIGTTNPLVKLQVGGTIGFNDSNIKLGDSTTGAVVTTGANNFFAGVGAGSSTTTGRDNNFFGCTTGASNTTGSNNNFFGTQAGYCNTTGSNNIFIGRCAGYYNTFGAYNNFFGRLSGYSNTTGEYNNFFSRLSGYSNTTGSNNNFFGKRAGYCNTTGNNNNFIGQCAGYSNTFGCYNNFFGRYTGISNTTGCYNNFFGNTPGRCNTTGSNNNFFGVNAGRYNTTGSHNNFFGYAGGYSNTTGSNNNFIGQCAGYSNTFGISNNFFGLRAGRYNTTGSSNNFIGQSAGRYNTFGGCNNFFGCNAGCCNTTGNYNNFFGATAGRCNTTGNSNNFLGFAAGRANTTGSYNTFIGYASGLGNTFGCFNNFIGHNTGRCNTTGNNNNFIGRCAGYSNTFGGYNNFFGLRAGLNNTTGCYNNFFGLYAGFSNTTGNHNNFIGYQAGLRNTTGKYNTFIGTQAGQCNTFGCYNNFFGFGAGKYSSTGCHNNFFGLYAGCKNTTGSHNNFFSMCAGFCNSTGSNNTFIGQCAGYSNTIGVYNIFIGDCAGQCNTTGTRNIFIGSLAGQANTTGTNNTFIGRAAGRCNTFGIHNFFVGNSTGVYNTSGSLNNFFGNSSGFCNTTGSNNNFIGTCAGCNNTTGSCNNFFGFRAGLCNTTGCYNNFFGCGTGLCNTTGNQNNFIGYYAGGKNNTGSCNTFLGRYAGCSVTTGSNNIALGSGAQVPSATGSCQLAIGAGGVNWIYGDSSGDVGIGTTNPTSRLEAVDLAANPSVAPVIFIQRPNNIIPGSIAPTNAELRIKGHSSNYKIYVEDHSSNSLFAVTGAGNLGIGVTNPFSKLQINYSSSTAYSATATPQTANAITIFNSDTTATTTFSSIALGNRRNGNSAFVGIECVGTGNDAASLVFKTQSAGPVFAEVARFDSSGRLTLPYQPAFIATKSSGQTLTQSVNNVVSFDTEVIDIGSNFSSNKFTAPVSGTYQFQFTCMGSSSNAGYLRIALKKNGSGFYGTTYATITISAYESIVTSSLINLSANDYVEAEIFPTMTSFALDNTGTFSGYLVG